MKLISIRVKGCIRCQLRSSVRGQIVDGAIFGANYGLESFFCND